MEIIILDSAYKHGISRQSIIHCLFSFINDRVLNVQPLKHLLVGFDNLGNALEIVAIEDVEKNRLVVIHAMKLRKKFYYLLEGSGYEL
ncbi:hypothetical protein LJC14_07370 [Treponema sp. OttesenSCG-928-L16]|nr:hypothetical protein [Treponema sp. OttesenSCG-928-L16]